MKLNYGSLIIKTIRLKGHTIQSVSKHLNIDKKLLQEWLKEESISTVLINNIGAVIIHDFSKDFPELFNSEVGENLDAANQNVGQPSIYLDKYVLLLEKYNKHLIDVIDNCREEYGESCCR